MVSHHIFICETCGTIISQCRCPSKDKEVMRGLCDKCRDKLQAELKALEETQ